MRSYLLAEFAVWFTVPVLFLVAYVLHFRNPAFAIAEHLYIIALFMLFGLLTKISLRRLLPHRLPADVLTALVYGSMLALLMAYYLVVLAGLHLWGKVISEELILSYVQQAPALCETLDISYFAVVTLVLAIWATVVGLYYYCTKRLQPDPGLPSIALPSTLTTLVLLCALLLVLHRMYMFISVPVIGSSEPFRLTAFSGKSNGVPRDPSVAYFAAFDADESAARANYQPAPPARRKNVILMIADALRADHLQPYGYPRPTSPFLQRLVDSGKMEKFDYVHSACAESTCSMASLVASRDPNRLPTDPFSVYQVLRLHGYTINMILGGDQTNYYNKRGLFGKVDSYYDGSMATGYYMSDDTFVLEKTRELQNWNGKPTFIQYHFLSTHLLGKKLDQYKTFTPTASWAGIRESWPRQSFTNLYDNGIVQFDSLVHEIIEALRKKHYLDDAIVIITSDHGENLGEKGRMSHADGVSQQVLHVPLLISGLQPRALPGNPGAPFIAQADIAPTILHDLGIPIPASWTGTPIQQLQAIGHNEKLEHFEMYDIAGVFDGRHAGRKWKYWINRRTKEEFVYDVSRDPLEMNNLLLQAPATTLSEWRRNVEPEMPR